MFIVYARKNYKICIKKCEICKKNCIHLLKINYLFINIDETKKSINLYLKKLYY